jgi:threonine aldolase
MTEPAPPDGPVRDRDVLFERCQRFLSGHGRPRLSDVLAELAQEAAPDEELDRYGRGPLVAAFEQEVAALLGQEAAVFLPSGTMAQQIALRLWSERRGSRTVAFHPTCHLEVHEDKAYQVLHGLHGRLVGDPRGVLTLTALQEVAEPLAALLLELPQREIGGQLPSWGELVAQTTWARERGIAVHMDGARLWEARPFYGRSYAAIAALFDSVYVSFYKGVGAIAGAALAGPADFIAEARLWQHRHGGTLVRLFPLVLSARLNLRRRLERFPGYHQRAIAVAEVLRGIPGVVVRPDPPHAHMMHVFLPGAPARLLEASLDIAAQEGVGLFYALQASEVPGYALTEVVIGDAAEALSDAEIEAYVRRVVVAGAG